MIPEPPQHFGAGRLVADERAGPVLVGPVRLGDNGWPIASGSVAGKREGIPCRTNRRITSMIEQHMPPD